MDYLRMFGAAAAAAADALGPFVDTYRGFSVAIGGKPELEAGDKIVLPSSALEALSRREVQFPMLFKLTNTTTGLATHVGVSEFTADEGQAFVPFWILSKLGAVDGECFLQVRNVQLPKATWVKFQPQTTDFIELANPKAVLENHLKAFSCLTKADTIVITYRGKSYTIAVQDLKPAHAASIIETDMVVEFAEPADYKAVQVARAAAAAAAGARSAGPSPALAGRTGSGGPALPPLGLGGAAGGGGGPAAAGAGAGTPVDGEAVGPGRTASGGAASPGVSRFAPRVVPFTGEGRRIGDGSPVVSAVGGGGGSVAAAGSGGSASPALSSIGGTLVSAGARPGSASGRPRTVNRFEAARQSKAFQGEGSKLR